MILTIAAGFSRILTAQPKQCPLREFLGIIAPGKLQYSSIVSFCKRLKTGSDVAILDNFQSQLDEIICCRSVCLFFFLQRTKITLQGLIDSPVDA